MKTVALLMAVAMSIGDTHWQSTRPEELIEAAISNYFLDVRAIPDFVCNMQEHVVSYRGSKILYEHTVAYEWIVAGGALHRWVIDPLDGSRLREFSSVGIPDVQQFDHDVPLKQISTLYRIRSARRVDLGDRPVLEVTLHPREDANWPKELTRFHTVRMWIDRSNRRIAKLLYSATGRHLEYVFSSTHPGFAVETHADLVGGPQFHRTRSTVDHTFVYKKFGVAARMLPR